MKKLALLLLIACPWFAGATTVAGVDLPETRGELRLNGAGLLRKGIFFKIYVGALYVANTNDVANILSDVPKRIDIHYFHHTPKRFMIKEANKIMEKNLTAERFEALKPMLDQLHEVFMDGEKGGRASILFNPGHGLTYEFNDQMVINIPSDEFANAYFSIWLGEKPSSRTIKEAMLKGGKG